MDVAQVQAAVEVLAAGLAGYAMLLVSVGALSMAFIEVFKGVLNARRWFNQGQVLAWLLYGKRSIWEQFFVLRVSASKSPDEHDLVSQFFQLAIGGQGNAAALFEQPIEKMFGQIQAATNVALEFPHKYWAFYRFLVVSHDRLRIAGESCGGGQAHGYRILRIREAAAPAGLHRRGRAEIDGQWRGFPAVADIGKGCMRDGKQVADAAQP